MANGEEGDDDGQSDVDRPDGRILHVHIRLATFRRVSVGAARQVLRPVHGRCIIQLPSAGAPLNSTIVSHTYIIILIKNRTCIAP